MKQAKGDYKCCTRFDRVLYIDFYDGTWSSGIFPNGEWCNGLWEDGEFVRGYWYNGVWIKGTWSGYEWYKGDWYGGVWNQGTWWDGNWYNGTWNFGHWYSGIWYNGSFNGGYFYNGVIKNMDSELTNKILIVKDNDFTAPKDFVEKFCKKSLSKKLISITCSYVKRSISYLSCF